MAKSFSVPTWQRMQAIDDRLTNLAKNTNARSVSAGQMTLRDLLDEAGFYDRVGGVDRVMQQAEAAADDITINQPLLADPFDVHEKAGDPFREAHYRDFFPAIDYASGNVPTEVFLTSDPHLHSNNAFYSNRILGGSKGSLIGGSAYAALRNNVPLERARSGVSMVTPEQGQLQTNTDLKATAAENRKKPEFQVLGQIHTAMHGPGSGTPEQYLDQLQALGEEVVGYNRTSVPPHVVLGVKGMSAPVLGHDFSSTLMHEMSHAGLQPEATAARTEGVFSPEVTQDLLDERPGYPGGQMGTLDPFSVIPRSHIPASEIDDYLRLYGNMRYHTTPIETDAVLADIKRAYAERTGRLVDSPEEAERALKFFRDYNQRGILDPVNLPYEVVATPLDADYFLQPEKYSPDESLGSDAYKTRMVELWGLGGLGVLAGLLGEEEDDGRVRY
jgi:hypothetical protein